MFGKRVQKTDNKPARSKPEPAGRERLKHFDAEIGKAKDAIAEIEQQIERFEDIIVDAAAAQQDLQKAIAADGGKALAEYAAGRGDEKISRLVLVADNSARAKTAAEIALPATQAALDNAKAQLAALGEQRAAELNRVLALLGDEDARAYRAAFAEMCMRHDKLVGYASVAQASHGDIQLIIEAPKTPRFAMPSLGDATADPFMRHQVSTRTVTEAAQKWTEVRARLEADASADLTDIL